MDQQHQTEEFRTPGEAGEEFAASAPAAIASAVAAASDCVARSRLLGAKGFVRLTNLIRANCFERLADCESRMIRAERFNRQREADRMRDFQNFYVGIIALTDSFIRAASDEAGIDRLGAAFGGPSIGIIPMPRQAIDETIAILRDVADSSSSETQCKAARDQAASLALMAEDEFAPAAAQPAKKMFARLRSSGERIRLCDPPGSQFPDWSACYLLSDGSDDDDRGAFSVRDDEIERE